MFLKAYNVFTFGNILYIKKIKTYHVFILTIGVQTMALALNFKFLVLRGSSDNSITILTFLVLRHNRHIVSETMSNINNLCGISNEISIVSVK